MMLVLGCTHAGNNLLIGNSNYNEQFVIRYLGLAAYVLIAYWLRKDVQKYLICPKQL